VRIELLTFYETALVRNAHNKDDISNCRKFSLFPGCQEKDAFMIASGQKTFFRSLRSEKSLTFLLIFGV